jgi:hypothetical protein
MRSARFAPILGIYSCASACVSLRASWRRRSHCSIASGPCPAIPHEAEARRTVAHYIFTDWQSIMCNDAFDRWSASAHWRCATMAMSLVEAAAATIIAFAILVSIVH